MLELKQEPFLKAYIDWNTELRRGAKKERNKIKKQNAKLRNNAIFSKSIENIMNKVDVRIVTTRKQYFALFKLGEPNWSPYPVFPLQLLQA